MSRPLIVHGGKGELISVPVTGHVLAHGSSLPTSPGYAPGGVFVRTGTNAGLYTNRGDVASPNFVPLNYSMRSVLEFIPASLHASIAAKTDTTDLTTYLQAANDACESDGAELYWPPGCYTFSSLTQDKHVRWVGAGWGGAAGNVNAAFNSSEWAANSNFAGTILRSTATSGAALSFTDPVDYPYRLERILLIGPGSGTSTGIKIGTSTQASIACRFVDVQVSNFATGWELNALYESRFDSCRSKGCSSGFKIQNATNDCHFSGIEVQHSTATGILCDNASGCTFTGLLLQNISGDAGLAITRACDNLTFVGGWAEASTATWTVNVGTTGSGACSAAFIGWRTSVTVGGGFQIDHARGVVFANCRMLSEGVTTTSNSHGTTLIGCNLTLTDNGNLTTNMPNIGGMDLGNGFIQMGLNAMGAGRMNIKENGTPGAPAADVCTIFARDTGGKTELCARFNTGAVQRLAIEP